MRVTILPSRAEGVMQAPPSKSMTHRMLICAGLAEGVSEIENVDISGDIQATLDCLNALGVEICRQGRRIRIRGTDIRKTDPAGILPCGDCGSSLRFFIPICLMNGRETYLTGSKELFQRPLAVYEKICKEQDLQYGIAENRLTLKGRLQAGDYEIPGDISSQFVSGLLFALPLLEENSRIRLIPPVESRSYILMTMQTLETFGIMTGWENDDTIFIRGKQKYLPQNVCIEGDYSNAAYFEALNLVPARVGEERNHLDLKRYNEDFDKHIDKHIDYDGYNYYNRVTVEGLSGNSLQGDRICRQYFACLREGFAVMDLSGCPDLGPVLMAVAAMNHGARFTGTRRLRFKESDRGRTMQEELRKLGVETEILEDEIRVSSGVTAPGTCLDGHRDHRIVMALSVILTAVGGTIEGAEAVNKSLPDFFERLGNLGIKMV